jgi:hypothetical protein
MTCRECGDKATHCVLSCGRIMPWFYCEDCTSLFRQLGHLARFVRLDRRWVRG